jgi:hypothetical protein
MRWILFLLLLPWAFSIGQAQTAKRADLPEYVFIPPSAEKYDWKRVALVRGRTLFANEIACSDSVVYSFGGFNTLRAQHEMNRLGGNRLIQDTLSYPGSGFMDNIFFIRDSLMFIGGGCDSGMCRYAYQDFWQYNLNSHEWRRLHDLPFYYLRSPTVFKDRDHIRVLIARLRGEQLREALPVFYEYDVQADRWKIISDDLPLTGFLTRYNLNSASFWLSLSAFNIGEYIYVLCQSSCNFQDDCANTLLRFNPQNGEWKALHPFPGGTQQMLLAAFAFSDGVYGYVAGGFGHHAGNSKDVYRYDPEMDKWEQIASLPLGVHWAKSWTYRGEHYVGFGINDKDLTVALWKLQRK